MFFAGQILDTQFSEVVHFFGVVGEQSNGATATKIFEQRRGVTEVAAVVG